MAWEILFYKTAGGRPAVQKFIDGLSETSRSKLAIKVDLLQLYGPHVRMPHSRSMGNGLFELRIMGRQEVRIFYSFVSGRRIYLLHGFVKKQQVTPKHEIEIALKRKIAVESL